MDVHPQYTYDKNGNPVGVLKWEDVKKQFLG